MMSRAAEKIDCERPTLSSSNKTHVWFSSDVPLTDVVDFYPFKPRCFSNLPLRSELHVKLFGLPGRDAVQQGDQQAEERV